MSITEMKTAIRKLPAPEVAELMTWLERYHEQLWDRRIADDLEAGRFDAVIAQAFASGEPSPLTKGDIDNARQIVKERLENRVAVK